jgi:hypothetical protein
MNFEELEISKYGKLNFHYFRTLDKATEILSCVLNAKTSVFCAIWKGHEDSALIN